MRRAIHEPALAGSRSFRELEVADGTGTRDHRDHNPGLYQLSYRHHALAQDTVQTRTAP